MNAEQAYLFRHVLSRDAAYQLQIPGARRRARRPKEDAYPEVLHFSTGLLPPRHVLHFFTALCTRSRAAHS